MHLVILSTDSRYDSGHRYQNTNVHLEIVNKRNSISRSGTDFAVNTH